MEIKKNPYRKKCDLGACKNAAEYCITFKNLGPSADLDICGCCLSLLYREAKKVIYGKKDKQETT